MAPQLQAVLTCLSQTQQPDPQVIKHAEAELQALATQPGFGAALTQIALASQEVAPAHLRQLAAVLLKQYVKQHWISGERGFVPPETSKEEKAQIRAALPAGLHDPDSKIRTAIAMAIAAVANWDWPQDWPGLLENIVTSIKERRDPNLVAGCLRCLKVMAADVDSEQAPGLLQSLSAELAEIVTNPQTPAGLAATCFNIMAQLTSALASLAGKYQRQVRDLLVPLVQPWVPLICGVLSSDPAARAGWPVKLGALRLGLSITSYFSKPLSAAMPHLMSATWQLLLALQPLHQSILIEGQGDDEVDQGDDGLDADEEPVGLEPLLAQLFELLTTFVEKPLLKPQVAAALKDMMYVTIAYLQMTQEQAETWVHSATQFVEDEDTDYTACRSCAQQLVVAVAEAFEDSGALPAVLEGVVRRWAEADADAAAGKPCWWQMREAGMLAASSCEATEFSPEHVQQLVGQLLQRDLQPLLQQQQQQQLGDAGQQFVMSRALKLGAYLHEEATAVHKQQLLQAAAVAVMSQAATPPLRLLGYKALAQLAPAIPPQHLAPVVTQLLPALLQQLALADEESLHLVLELLHVVLEAASTPGSAGLAPEQALAVAQPVLQVWLQHTSDPLIAPDAQDVIGALANHSQCLPSLVQAAAPTLAAILQRGAAVGLAKQQGQTAAAASAAAAAAASAASAGLHLPEETAMLVEASLDLLGALVKPGQDATTLELCHGVLGPVLSLIQSSGDASELSSAVSLLLKFLRTCPTQQLLVCAARSPAAAASSSSAAEEAGLAALVVTARQLLASSQQDDAVRLAGPLMAQLLKVLPQQMCSPLPAAAAAASSNGSAQASGSCVGVLLYDTVVRMASAETCSPRTVAHLLEFVVRLVLLPAVGAQGVVELLAAMSVPRQDGSSVNGLCVLMPLWLDHAADMVGALQAKQCAAALMEMLKLRHHPALAGVAVQGRLLDVDSGRLTRSKAREQGGLRYSQVPATAKVLQVLGALLSTEAEPAAGGMQFGAEGLWGSEDGGDADSDTSGSYEEEELEGAAMEHLENAAVLKAAGLAASASNEDILRASWQDVMDRSVSATPAPEDPSDAQDPLSAVSTRNIIKQGLSALAAADSAFLAASAEHLGPCRELQVLQELLK